MYSTLILAIIAGIVVIVMGLAIVKRGHSANKDWAIDAYDREFAGMIDEIAKPAAGHQCEYSHGPILLVCRPGLHRQSLLINLARCGIRVSVFTQCTHALREVLTARESGSAFQALILDDMLPEEEAAAMAQAIRMAGICSGELPLIRLQRPGHQGESPNIAGEIGGIAIQGQICGDSSLAQLALVLNQCLPTRIIDQSIVAQTNHSATAQA